MSVTHNGRVTVNAADKDERRTYRPSRGGHVQRTQFLADSVGKCLPGRAKIVGWKQYRSGVLVERRRRRNSDDDGNRLA